MKFILKASDENLELIPFENKQAGKLYEENSAVKKVSNVHFDQSQVYFRNEYIQKIVSLLTTGNQKMIEVTGKAGVGKRSIVYAAAGYLIERNFFLDGVFLLKVDPQMNCF